MIVRILVILLLNILALPITLTFVVVFTTANRMSIVNEIITAIVAIGGAACILTGLVYHFSAKKGDEEEKDQ